MKIQLDSIKMSSLLQQIGQVYTGDVQVRKEICSKATLFASFK